MAQYLASRQIVLKRSDIKHILIIDDDVTLPENIRFPTERIDDLTRGIAIGIRGVDSHQGQKMLFTQWQDLEYKLSDYIRVWQDKYASVLFPHGAISLWLAFA